jgi:hypothetical protein
MKKDPNSLQQNLEDLHASLWKGPPYDLHLRLRGCQIRPRYSIPRLRP